MDIKVGDIVEYKGEIVRLMAVFPSRLVLTLFGLVADNPSSLRLVESAPSPECHHDDEYGEIACVNGLWFHTYHLDPVSDFDIV